VNHPVLSQLNFLHPPDFKHIGGATDGDHGGDAIMDFLELINDLKSAIYLFVDQVSKK
jgi:hypothetical protein